MSKTIRKNNGEMTRKQRKDCDKQYCKAMGAVSKNKFKYSKYYTDFISEVEYEEDDPYYCYDYFSIEE